MITQHLSSNWVWYVDCSVRISVILSAYQRVYLHM